MEWYESLKEPIFSTWWGVLSLIGLTIMTGSAAFLARLAWLLRVRGWWLVGALLALYCVVSLDFPHPTVRTYLDHRPTPPLDTGRLVLLSLVLSLGSVLLSTGIARLMERREKA